jgi:TIR domain-containing protein
VSKVNGADVGGTGRALRVFVSYATPDRAYARQLESLLSQRASLRVFTTDALSAGEDWEPKLRDEIAQSDVFIVLLSPASVASKWVLHELGAAWALNKPIIPVLTQPEAFSKVPVELQDRKPVSLSSLDNPEVVSQLLEPFEKAALGNSRKAGVN